MSSDAAHTQRRRFAILLAIIEVIVTIFFGIFMRVEPHKDNNLHPNYYPMYQDVNVMMLIGFGFLMTFIKNYTWSTLSYTFFLNAVIVQLYLLFQPFWHTVF
jgi:ammonium transporter Rh